ncbi:hypothetical protein [Roseixanthobacter liquoris]|uniref:hypothetical protein n=1 Tax=Roseixanthobacter liquoris TaxID=3119921 RepID=UPI00372C36CE
MSEAIILIDLNRPADRIVADLQRGGIDTWVYWWFDGDTMPLFKFEAPPSPQALTLACAITERWEADAALRENFIAWAINIGAACQDVDRPAWKFRALTDEEEAALSRDEQRTAPGESGEVLPFISPRDSEGGAA